MTNLVIRMSEISVLLISLFLFSAACDEERDPSAVRPGAMGESDSSRLTGQYLGHVLKIALPPDSPLWRLPNVLVTPHNAGFSFPEEIVRIFADNYRRFRENRPLRFEVDFQREY